MVAVTMQVPAEVADKVDPLSAQPVAVPFVTLKVRAPVPDPPLVVSANGVPTVPLVEVTVRVACGLGSGGTLAATTVMVIEGLTASGLTPLVAEMVKVKGPVALGVPESTPVLASKVRPVGKVPEASVKVGAGVPLAEKV